MLLTVTFGGVRHWCTVCLGQIPASRYIYAACPRWSTCRGLFYHGNTVTKRPAIFVGGSHGSPSSSPVLQRWEHWASLAKQPKVEGFYQQAACLCGSFGLSANKESHSKVPSRIAPPKYLASRKWARTVIQKLQEVTDLTGPDITVYDCTPGEGVLCQELLKAGIQSITCWILKASKAKAGHKRAQLSELEKASQGRVSIKRKAYYINILTTFGSFPFQGTEIPGSAKKVRVLASLRMSDLTVFLSQLVLLFSLRPELASEMSGHLEHYLYVNSYELRCMEGVISNRSFHLGFAWLSLFHLFFSIDCLLQIPVVAFMPANPAAAEDDHLHLVKLNVRPQAIECLPQDQMEPFLRFVKDLLSKPKQRLIPQMEQWHPGIGITLLQLGYGMMHTNQELKLQHYIQVFQVLYNSPDYKKLLLDRGKFGPTISLIQKHIADYSEDFGGPAVVASSSEDSSDHFLDDLKTLQEGFDE